MRAFTADSGLDITLILEDKKIGDRTKQVTTISKERKKPQVTIHITKNAQKRGLEEPGFHIQAYPKKAGPDERTRYEIYLSPTLWKKLTNPEEDPVRIGGYFGSRCKYDRVDIKFFAV